METRIKNTSEQRTPLQSKIHRPSQTTKLLIDDDNIRYVNDHFSEKKLSSSKLVTSVFNNTKKLNGLRKKLTLTELTQRSDSPSSLLDHSVSSKNLSQSP